MTNIFTIEYDLPATIRSFVRYNPDDSYTIMLNARLNREMRLKAYKHELDHIMHNDIHSNEDVGIIENRAHSATNERK